MSASRGEADWRRELRRREGVFDLDDARRAGFSADEVGRRVASGEWDRAAWRVLQVADHARTPRARVIAAMLSLGPHATLVGPASVWWWHMDAEPPGVVDVAVPTGARPRPRPGVRLTRRTVDDRDRRGVDGLMVASRPLALLTAAHRLGITDAAHLVDRALLRGAVDLDALREVHRRTAGRHGTARGRELLALAGGGARSEAERSTHRALRRAVITGWAANVPIDLPGFGRAVGDVVFGRERVVVEVDGWAYHRDLRAFLLDGPRQSALAAAGWVVLRTHWYELRGRPGVFLDALRGVLIARS